MKPNKSLVTLLLAFLLLGTQVFAQPSSTLPNLKNPPAFQNYAAPVSSTVAFLASEAGKQLLLSAPNPMAKEFLARYHGPAAAAAWDRIPHNYLSPTAPPRRKSKLQGGDPVTRCAATRFNLEPATNALPQNEESIDFKFGAVAGGAGDETGEGANDFRGFFLNPIVWSPSISGYYVERAAGCVPQFEGGLPPIPDPFISGNRLFGRGDPILIYDTVHDAWFYSSLYTSSFTDGVGVFRNPNSNIMNTTTCPNGTHGFAAAMTCWPLGPASAGFNAIIVDEQSGANFADKDDMWVDSRISGSGAGNIYITDTLFAGVNGAPGCPPSASCIRLTACNNSLTACSVPKTISGADFSNQFSDVKTKANGTITVTYGVYFQSLTPSGIPLRSVDIKYVTCTPNGAPLAPTCGAPVLITSDLQPIGILADLTDVRNSTYPVHVEAGAATYVFWERCKVPSDLPFFGSTSIGGFTCPSAGIVGAVSINGGLTWSAPFAVDTTAGHHIMPWAAYDSSRDTINLAYEACDAAFNSQCRLAWRQILTASTGTTAVQAALALSSYQAPESEANRPFFAPLFGDYIGVAVHGNGAALGSHVWFGFTDTSRLGIYGFGTTLSNESNNNLAAQDY